MYGLEEIQQESHENEQRFPFEWRNSQNLWREFTKNFKKNFENCGFSKWEDDGVPTTFQAILGLFNNDDIEERAQIFSQMDLLSKSDPLLQTEDIRASGVTENTTDLETENVLLSMLDPKSDDTSEGFYKDDDEIDALLAEIQTPMMTDFAKQLYSAATPTRKNTIDNNNLEQGSLAAYYSMASTPEDSVLDEQDANRHIPQLDGSYDEDLDLDLYDEFSEDHIMEPKNCNFINNASESSLKERSNVSEAEEIYVEPFFSKTSDLPRDLQDLSKSKDSGYDAGKWKYKKAPPSSEFVKEWRNRINRNNLSRTTSFLEGPTQNSDKGIKRSQPESEKAQHKKNYLTLLSLEMHGKSLILTKYAAHSSQDKLPNPDVDPITVIFYSIYNEDVPELGTNGLRPGFYVGAIAVKDEFNLFKMGISGKSIRLNFRLQDQNCFK